MAASPRLKWSPRTCWRSNEKPPCPCGFLGDARRPCKCAPQLVERYVARISGPLLDRIDLHVEVPAVPYQELTGRGEGPSSTDLRAVVVAARAVQRERFGGDGLRLNSRMAGRAIRQYCQLDEQGQQLLRTAVESLGLSARAHDRVLRVARTIADLAASPKVETHHLAEALNYRILDRKLWVQ